MACSTVGHERNEVDTIGAKLVRSVHDELFPNPRTHPMPAIDLLLHSGLETEVVHQLVLSLLLRHSDLLDRLVPGFGPTTTVEWEPRGGLYDLGAMNATGQSALIELKVDAHLPDYQIETQVGGRRASDQLVYVLLGHTRLTSRPRLDHKLASTAVPASAAHPPAPRVVELRDLRDVLPRLTVTTTSEPPADILDLAAAYDRLLTRVEHRTHGFFEHPLAQWGKGEQWAYYYGFFDHCRRTIPSMHQAGISLVPTPKGSFFACHWKWTTIEPGVEAYLQFQDSKLCFKISVDQGEPGAIRNRVLARVHELCQRLELPVQRPAKLGHGQTMTVGILDAEQTGLGIKDRWDHFAAIVGRAEQVIEHLGELQSTHP